MDRVHRPGKREFFENWVKPRKPVIMTGLLEDWPALGKWTPEFFADLGGDRPVRIEFGNVLHQQPRFTHWEFRRYIQTLANPGGDPEALPYLAYFDIFKFFPGLQKDLGFPFWSGRIRFPIGWIGPAGSFTGLHYDIADNLFAQVHGSKEFTLYPPGQTPFLYPGGKYDIGSVISDIDVKHPDFNRFPLFRRAQGTRITVSAGEVLFTPKGWWHSVLGLETSISVSCFGFGIGDTLFSGIPGAVKHALHNLGWYRRGNCACHMRAGAASRVENPVSSKVR
jgi:hypothetical protein